jgi:sigma-B regulation protein RsbU (phosphoserine phosphatase)
VLVRASGRVETRGEPSLPLGLFEAVDPVEVRVGLGPGDSLVFYTDGVTEARNTHGELFGEQRLLHLLNDCTSRNGEQIAHRIVEAAKAFSSGTRTDDLAVLVVRVPEDARADPIGRVATATGVPEQDLRLPGYPHGGATVKHGGAS